MTYAEQSFALSLFVSYSPLSLSSSFSLLSSSLGDVLSSLSPALPIFYTLSLLPFFFFVSGALLRRQLSGMGTLHVARPRQVDRAARCHVARWKGTRSYSYAPITCPITRCLSIPVAEHTPPYWIKDRQYPHSCRNSFYNRSYSRISVGHVE